MGKKKAKKDAKKDAKKAKSGRKGKAAADPSRVLADPSLMPLTHALQCLDNAALGAAITSTSASSTSVVSLSKTLGEAFTGGRSTPVYDIVLREGEGEGEGEGTGDGDGDGDGERGTCGRARETPCVAKVVELGGASDRFKAESYHVEASFYLDGACEWLSQAPLCAGEGDNEDDEGDEEGGGQTNGDGGRVGHLTGSCSGSGHGGGSGGGGGGCRRHNSGTGGKAGKAGEGGEGGRGGRGGLVLPRVLAIERESPLSSPGRRPTNGALFCFLMSDLRATHPLHPRGLDLNEALAAVRKREARTENREQRTENREQRTETACSMRESGVV